MTCSLRSRCWMDRVKVGSSIGVKWSGTKRKGGSVHWNIAIKILDKKNFLVQKSPKLRDWDSESLICRLQSYHLALIRFVRDKFLDLGKLFCLVRSLILTSFRPHCTTAPCWVLLALSSTLSSLSFPPLTSAAYLLPQCSSAWRFLSQRSHQYAFRISDEPPRKMSGKTVLWGLLVRLVSGYKPSLYSCQKSLPFLPVPHLNDTLEKFLLSIEPLYGKDSEEFRNFKKQAEVNTDSQPKSLVQFLRPAVCSVSCKMCRRGEAIGDKISERSFSCSSPLW